MANFSPIRICMSATILIVIYSRSSRGYPFEVIPDPIPSPLENSPANGNRPIETMIIDKFFSDYDADIIEPDDLNESEKEVEKTRPTKFKNEYSKLKSKAKLEELKTNLKIKPFMKTKISKPSMDNTNINVDPLYPADEKLFKVMSEKFIPVWPKYLDDTKQQLLPFPELTQSRLRIVEDENHPEEETKKRVRKSHLNTDKIILRSEKSNPKIDLPRIESNMLPMEKLSAKGENAQENLQKVLIQKKVDSKKSLKNKIYPINIDELVKTNNQKLITSLKPIYNNMNASETTSKSDEHTPSTQVEDEKKIIHINTGGILQSEPINMPWDLRKTNGFFPVMPFPELHQLRRMQPQKFIPDKTDSSYKRVLPVLPIQRTLDVAGPVLYPQSNFEKTFHVPFF